MKRGQNLSISKMENQVTFQIKPEEKQTIQTACDLIGVSFSAFVRMHSLKEARLLIKDLLEVANEDQKE